MRIFPSLASLLRALSRKSSPALRICRTLRLFSASCGCSVIFRLRLSKVDPGTADTEPAIDEGAALARQVTQAAEVENARNARDEAFLGLATVPPFFDHDEEDAHLTGADDIDAEIQQMIGHENGVDGDEYGDPGERPAPGPVVTGDDTVSGCFSAQS